MNSVLITILSLSASGSVVALLLLMMKPLVKRTVSKAFSYYIWLFVLLRLSVPLAAPVNVMDTLFHTEVSDAASVDQQGSPAVSAQAVTDPDPAAAQTASPATQTPQGSQRFISLWESIGGSAVWIWLAGSAAAFGWFTVSYALFSRRIRRSLLPPHRDDLAVFRQMSGGSRVRLACSCYVTTPILIGAVRPVIVLPPQRYVRSGMESELRDVLRHELTHYRRRDILYKWLAVAVSSLHWFNPLMPLIRREISRACELSCDESVIRGMTAREMQRYGNTLLSFSAGRRYPAGALATTFGEEKAELKERLIGIMNYKKKSTLAVALALVLTLLLAGCTATLGVAKSAGSEPTPSDSGEPTPSASAKPDKGSTDGETGYYGTWVVQSVLAYGPVGTYSTDDAEKLVGQSLVFSAEEASVISDEASDPVVSIDNPEYQENTLSDSDFLADYRMSFSQLGIDGASVTAVVVTDSEGVSGTFLMKDSNTIVFVAGGTFFELARQ